MSIFVVYPNNVIFDKQCMDPDNRETCGYDRWGVFTTEEKAKAFIEKIDTHKILCSPPKFIGRRHFHDGYSVEKVNYNTGDKLFWCEYDDQIYPDDFWWVGKRETFVYDPTDTFFSNPLGYISGCTRKEDICSMFTVDIDNFLDAISGFLPSVQTNNNIPNNTFVVDKNATFEETEHLL